MKRIWFQVGMTAMALLGGIECLAQLPAKGPRRINSRRPLADAANVLRHLYGKIITYEEPVLVWDGDLEPLNAKMDPTQKWAVAAKRQAFTTPQDTGTEPNLALMLDETLKAFHQQTPGTRFKILSSAWGYHIVPVQVHDLNGQLAAASSPLDTPVYVPVAERAPSQHLAALITAIGQGRGPLTELSLANVQSFDRLFRSSPDRFQWGVTGVVVRDAMIDLLQRSATSFYWNANCFSSFKAEDRGCVVNMEVLQVTVTDPQGKPANRFLQFDRCGNCPAPVPPPPSRAQPLKEPDR